MSGSDESAIDACDTGAVKFSMLWSGLAKHFGLITSHLCEKKTGGANAFRP